MCLLAHLMQMLANSFHLCTNLCLFVLRPGTAESNRLILKNLGRVTLASIGGMRVAVNFSLLAGVKNSQVFRQSIMTHDTMARGVVWL